MANRDKSDGLQATRDEMSYPDWKKRLARAEREIAEGKGQSLESYLKVRSGKR